MNYSPDILREQERDEIAGMRLYFMGQFREPLIDPRDIPRGSTGYPEPNFEIKLKRGAIAAARAGSFIDAYATGDFGPCFDTPPTVKETSSDQPDNITELTPVTELNQRELRQAA